MKQAIMTIALGLFFSNLSGQIWNGQDSLYGNEWVRYDRTYYKIPIAEDGIYRLSVETLQSLGLPVGQLQGQQLQLYHLGVEQPVYLSSSGPLGDDDFLEFYGRRNRTELDKHLYFDPDTSVLNTEYSLFTDTAAYFLTWTDDAGASPRLLTADGTPSGSQSPEPWYWSESVQYFTQAMNKRYRSASNADIAFSDFDGDGFTTNLNRKQSVTLDVPAIAPDGPAASLHMRMISNDNAASHQLQISIGNEILYTESYHGAELRLLDFERPTAGLNPRMTIQVEGLNGSNDRYGIAEVRLRYARRFDLGGAGFMLLELPEAAGPRLLEWNNMATAGDAVLYDLDSGERYTVAASGGVWRVQLKAAAGPRRLAISGAPRSITAAEVTPVTFRDFRTLDPEFIIISNRRLFDDGKGNNWVEAYAEYRRSADGGGYRTLIAEVQQLYDQFAYGLNRHPLAIRHFVHYLQQQSGSGRYVLLIGKARYYNRARTPGQLLAQSNESFYVPTYGNPGSDHLLLAAPHRLTPILPVGRIAASNADDIRLYLNKLKGYEANARSEKAGDRSWRKNVMHLGGGGGGAEQTVIRNALTRMENILENNDYGAEVFSFYKTSPDPIQQSQSEIITGNINRGTGIMTFFGHSSSGGFDFSLDDPATYTNVDRYPVMFSLGCLSGLIHDDFQSVGERFILQEKSGAIAFMATVGFGFINALDDFTNRYYRLLGGEMYGRGIGDVTRSTIAYFEQNPTLNIITLLQQFTLNGDPSLSLMPYDGPDYLIEEESVRFLPKVINAQLDSFTMEYKLVNAARAVEDSIWIEVGRQFPDGTQVVAARQRVAAPAFESVLRINLPVLGSRSIGFNRLTVSVDADNELSESPAPAAEQNNELIASDGRAGIELYIHANGIRPVSPPEFGIMTSEEVTLWASTANPFAPAEDFIFEIDTNARFDSPVLYRQTLRQSGGLLRWSPDINWQEGRVYYWRVSPDSTEQFGYLWEGSSFLYAPAESEGWNQSHADQLRRNAFDNMEVTDPGNRLKFLDDVKTVRVTNGVYPDVWPDVRINNDPFGYLPWDDPVRGGLYIYVLDGITADAWINIPPGDYGSHVSPWAYWAAYPFRTQTQEQRELAIRFLRDIIPSGNYVLIFTVQHKNTSYKPEEWAADSLAFGTNLFQLLEAQGAGQLRTTATTGARPYVVFYKKDDPDFPIFEQLVGLEESIQQTFAIPGRWDSGSVRSTRIGPAQQWGQLAWQLSDIDPFDQTGLDVYGIRADSTRMLLRQNVQERTLDLSGISAEAFPYLQLQYHAVDTNQRTAPLLDYWRVVYTGMPEAALNPHEWQLFRADTLQRGEEMQMGLAVRNISTSPMDSLLVYYTLTDEDNNTRRWERRYRPLPAGDTLHIGLHVDTRALRGLQQIAVEANPDEDQPERYHLNNIGFRDFLVEADERDPVLDVTFDGVRILNGDIVSPSPLIVVTLRDENRFLPLVDTSVLRVFLQYPNESEVRPVAFSSGQVRFIPAQLDEQGRRNEARLELTPDFPESGTYTLTVQGRDASGNVAGGLDYKVSFEVIREARLSNVLNYPNPFSTSTQFVYTLTGEEPPADFMIRIMTVSGRVVRELTPADLGPLRIGTHRTDGTWDGTDAFGDRLANGVYLYQVIARDAQGNAYEKHDNGTDSFFEHNIGKLVILR